MVTSASATLPTLVHAQTPKTGKDADEATVINSEQMTGRPDREVDLDRDVELSRGTTVVKADKAIYKIIKDEVDATGDVWMKRLTSRYTGDHAVLNIDSGVGYVTNPTYVLGPNAGRGKAQRADFLSDDEAVLTQSTYSTCEAANPDWYLKAQTLDLDQGRDVGTITNGIVYFKDVPIFGSPWLDFPLSNARKSGVLSPTFGTTSTGGMELAVPYYFNIAPNRDLTVTPKYIARRGLQMGATGRYLGDTYSGVTSGEWIEDKLTQTERYWFSSTHKQTLGNGFGFSWNVAKASDNNYPTDFASTVNATTQRLLERNFTTTYSSTYWSASLLASKYQLLQDVNAPIQKPYDRMPQLTVTGTRPDVDGFDLGLTGEFTRFSNTNSITGQTMVGGDRAAITQQVSYPIIGTAYYVTPKISLDATTYHLNNQQVGLPTDLTRVLPSASIDSGLTFERDATFFGRSMTQTFEPRVYYLRTPYVDQSQYPVFDTALADFNFAQIFSDNRFVGRDRISDANQITVGATSRFIEANGTERLRVAVAQRYYFTQPRVFLTPQDALTTSKSDLLAGLTGPVTNELSIDTAVQYSQSLAQMQKANYGIRWQPAPKKVLNLSYRLDRTVLDVNNNILKQYDLSGQWPLSQRWYGVGRINYSIPDKTVTEGLLGMEYRADCWVFRVVAQRIPTSSLQATTSFFVQLELNGFAKIGSNPMDALTSSIPGYQIVNRPDSLPSY
ncbi:MAG: OstA organic solvent tolerance protein [Herbaspirillum sp.]|nr:OstA organic solvent tolerance protein [Herbaspirillum sp.]